MILTLDVSPETVKRVEQAKSQGANRETLLCSALEQWFNATASNASSAVSSLQSLAGKYEGEAWDELLAEIERNRLQEVKPINNLRGAAGGASAAIL